MFCKFCHFYNCAITVKLRASIAKTRSVMSDSLWPLDCSLPGSSVCGIFQVRILLEWVAISSSKSWKRTRLNVSHFLISSLSQCYCNQNSVVCVSIQTEQRNRTESPEMNPHNHSQMIHGKEAKTIQWGKKQHFQHTIVRKLDIHMHKNKLYPYLTLYTKRTENGPKI